MIAEDIISAVEAETNITLDGMKAAKGIRGYAPGTLAYNAKCIAIMLMREEEYSVHFIARKLSTERTLVYHILRRVDRVISTPKWAKGYNKKFKELYLACRTRMAAMEEKTA